MDATKQPRVIQIVEQLSGKENTVQMIVRLPKSLHLILKAGAHRDMTSLNKFCIALLFMRGDLASELEAHLETIVRDVEQRNPQETRL